MYSERARTGYEGLRSNKTSNVKLEPLQYQPDQRGGTARAADAPIWRKTRAQRTDDKVENILESYRMIDQALMTKNEKRGQDCGQQQTESTLERR